MDIEKQLYIWISDTNKHEQGWALDGLSFDGSFGLGGEDTRKYSGDLAIINKENRIAVSNCIISMMHTSGKGLNWFLNSDQPLPDTPFLLTNNYNVVWNEYRQIELSINPDTRKFLYSSREKYFSVYSKSWIAVLQIDSKNKFTLTLFSETKEPLKKGQQISFGDWDEIVGFV